MELELFRRTPGGRKESKASDEDFHKSFLQASRKEIFQGSLPTTTELYEEGRKEI
jgi:hypothetical protein